MSDQHIEHITLAGDTEDPRGDGTWLLGAVSTLVLIAFVVASIGMFYMALSYETENKAETIRSMSNELMRAERRTQLEQEPHWEAWTDIDGELAGERQLKVSMDTAIDIVTRRWGGDRK
jgi:hypothetical protein